MVTVSVDGVPIAPTTSSGALVWIWDSTSNFVHFEPLYPPEPGQTVVISYSVACLP